VSRRRRTLDSSSCSIGNEKRKRRQQVRARRHLLCFSLAAKQDNELGVHRRLLLQKTTMNPGLSLSSCVLSITYKWWRWVEGSSSLIFFQYLKKTMASRHLLSSFFCFVFVHLEKTMTTSRLVFIFFCFLFAHPKKTTTSQRSSLFLFKNLMCTHKKWRQVGICHCLFLVFFLCTHKRWQQVSAHCCLFLFSFCALGEDDDDRCSSLSCFLLFLCT
jgi:hypothetical protein